MYIKTHLLLHYSFKNVSLQFFTLRLIKKKKKDDRKFLKSRITKKLE